ncbi:MAG: octaprenyl-diphosphate synthase, partial [Gemmatimonadota bacterium]|nr:octaprenyl-diphosphate synthase [Gemmatimonadota bacterium]
VTLPLIEALRTMSPAARREVEVLFDTPEPGDARIARVIEIVAESGGLDYARRRGAQFADAAEDALGALPETPAVGALHDAVAYALDRSQ